MRTLSNMIIGAIFVAMAGLAQGGTPSKVVFSGESIYKQPIKVALLEDEDSTYKLTLTVIEFDEVNGTSYRTTKIVDGLSCEIEELSSVNCVTFVEENERVRFYTNPAEQANRFQVMIEASSGPFPLGFSMVWETR